MAVLKSSGSGGQGLLRMDDEAWMRGILDLVPKSVYGQVSSSGILDEDSKSEAKKNKKRSEIERGSRKTRADKRSDDNQGSGRATLQRKLNEKILEKRTARKADDESRIEVRMTKKRKRDEQSKVTARERKKSRSIKDVGKEKAREDKVDSQDVLPPEHRKRKLEDDEQNANLTAIETTRLDGFNSEQRVKKVKRRKLRGGKLLELQKKLEEATKENSANKTQSKPGERQDGEGDGKAHDPKEREMEKALQRAQGTTIRDDVKKLKKSIRREKRRSEKSREDWAKRAEMQDTEQKARQDKKARNLEERKSTRKSTAKGQATTGKKR